MNMRHMHSTSPTLNFRLSLCVGVLICSAFSHPLKAESGTLSNVMGDEIVIHTEDSVQTPANSNGTRPNSASGSALSPNSSYNSGVSSAATLQNERNAKEFGKKSNTQNFVPNYGAVTVPNYNSESVAGKPKRNFNLEDILDVPAAESNTTHASEDINRNDLWQRIKNGYAIPDSTSPLTRTHETWYSSRPDYVKRMVERSQRYLFHVVEEVEKRGMPTEIALLPMIESAYNPKAYSTSKASGIWQFIPSTGKHFGLKQNWWFDNRRNITFATDAALTYLQKLHAMFGAWDLALAAYNAGEGTVSRAIERNRKLGLPTDYESLNLPPETRNYVPKLQAVKNIMTNPSNYGLNIQTIANTPYFAKVNAPAQIDARLAAKLAEISDEEFLALNPSFNRPLITSEEKTLELLLPIVSAQTFRTNLESYNKPLVSWQTYFAKPGERLEKIAKQFGIHVSKLRDVNDLPANKKIKKPATLIVPNGKSADFKPPAAPNNSISIANTTETIMPSDADSYASRYLAQSEESTDKASVEILDAVENEPNIAASVTHKVEQGESIYGIAKRYGISVKQLKADNGLKSSNLLTGQILKISSTAANTDAKPKSTKSKTKTKTYTVKRGDTLHGIAERFDVALVDLKRWNNIKHNRIKPGSKLNIFEPNSL